MSEPQHPLPADMFGQYLGLTLFIPWARAVGAGGGAARRAHAGPSLRHWNRGVTRCINGWTGREGRRRRYPSRYADRGAVGTLAPPTLLAARRAKGAR